ncbi:uncharacterized protein LOC135400021 isoform X3 [Ornithodoros turicata]|uniref:uncharacterized protein LOC135400021 isoform X3 n=1 Tax=Ornithodoros turicata TaxID=34597 RepID=UPI00313869DB
MSFRKTLWILIAYNVVVEKGSFTSDVLVAYRAGGRTMNEEVSTSSDNVTVTAINEDAPDKLEAPLSPPLHVAQLKTPGEIICDDDLVEENVMPAHKKRPSEQGTSRETGQKKAEEELAQRMLYSRKKVWIRKTGIPQCKHLPFLPIQVAPAAKAVRQPQLPLLQVYGTYEILPA